MHQLRKHTLKDQESVDFYRNVAICRVGNRRHTASEWTGHICVEEVSI